jgi:hypothetical protein
MEVVGQQVVDRPVTARDWDIVHAQSDEDHERLNRDEGTAPGQRAPPNAGPELAFGDSVGVSGASRLVHMPNRI